MFNYLSWDESDVRREEFGEPPDEKGAVRIIIGVSVLIFIVDMFASRIGAISQATIGIFVASFNMVIMFGLIIIIHVSKTCTMTSQHNKHKTENKTAKIHQLIHLQYNDWY